MTRSSARLPTAVLLVAFVLPHSVATSPAQTVQLPTYRVFSTNSSVLVPDRGAAYLGGNPTVRSGSSRLGLPVLGRLGRPFQNTAFGNEVTGNHSWVTAQIIDHREWDAAVLDEARQRRLAGGEQATNGLMETEATFLSQHMGRTSRAATERTAESLASRQSRRPADDAPLRLGSVSPAAK